LEIFIFYKQDEGRWLYYFGKGANMKIRSYFFPALLAPFLLLTSSGACAQDSMTLLAGQASLVKTQTWIDFLKKNEIAVDHYVPSELAKVKDKKFITIIGGLDEPGVKDILMEVCGAADVASLAARGSKKMYLKENVWKPNQKVLVFAGADADAAASVRTESRETWMKYLKDWFDLGDSPGGLRAY
jgi:hypothetical protein